MTGVRDFGPDRWLDEGDQVSIGELTFDILHCPGHSPGSVVFFNKELRFAHVGDVLFNGSVGRTDLPGGSHATLISSIKEKLLPLGDDVGFICGHGAGSSIGQERLTNPFITGEIGIGFRRAEGRERLFHQPRGRQGAGDDDADIDAAALWFARRWVGWRTGLWDLDQSVAARSDDCRLPWQPTG